MADTKKTKVDQLNQKLNSASETLTGAKSKLDGLKQRIEKSRDALARLDKGKGPAADALRSGGILDKLKSAVGAVETQVPGLTKIVDQSVQALPRIKGPVDQAAKLLQAVSDVAQGKADPKAVLEKLARVQGQALGIEQQISGVFDIVKKGGEAVPAIKQRMDEVQKIVADVAAGRLPAGKAAELQARLAQLVEEAAGQSGIAGEIAKHAAQFGDLSKLADEGNKLLEGLAGEDLLPAVKDKVSQMKKALDQARQQMPNATSMLSGLGSSSTEIASLVEKAKSIVGNVQKVAGGELGAKIAKVREDAEKFQAQLGGLTSGLTAAAKNMPGMEKQLGRISEIAAMLQPKAGASIPPGLAGELKQLVSGLSLDLPISGDIQAHVKAAQATLAQIQGGELPAAAKDAMAQMEKLFGDAGKQLPDLTKVAGLAGQLKNAKNIASSITPDFIRQLSQGPVAKSLLDKAKQQFPEASQAVSKLTENLPKLQQSMGQAQQLLADITSGKIAAGGALEQLAKSADVQQLLKQAEQFSGVTKLISEGRQGLQQLQSRVAQASDLMNSFQNGDFSPAELGSALSDMTGMISRAAKTDIGKQLSDAMGPAANIGSQLQKVQAAFAGIQHGQLPLDAQQAFLQVRKALTDAGAQLPEISISISQAAGKFSSLAEQLKNADASSAGFTAAFAAQIAQSAEVKGLLDKVKQQFPEAASLVSQAAAALPKLQESFAAGQKLLSDVASGAANPEDVLRQLSSSSEVQALLKKAGEQFPEAARLISQANEMLPQLQQGFAQAKSIAADLQKGDLTAVAAALGDSPQVQHLLAAAQNQFPEVAGLVKQAQAAIPQIQAGLAQAKDAFGDLQKGDYKAALGKLGGMSQVQDLLAEAQKQFPGAAALVSQANEMLPQIQAGLAQANQALAAFQEGDPIRAAQQLAALPGVQNLLAEAQNQFPEAAALAAQAAEGFAAVQGGLDQASAALAAFQSGDTNAALAALTELPIAQQLLEQAQQQFPEAAAALSQAAALMPEVQAHLAQAAELIDAAVAGDLDPQELENLPVVQSAIAAAATAVAAATAATAVEEVAAAATASGDVVVTEIEDETPAEEPPAEEGEVILEITTALDPETFEVLQLTGEDRMSGLFYYRAELTSQDKNIDFSQVVGEGATVKMLLGPGEYRYINGIVSRMTQGATDADDNTTYFVELRPWLWKLTKTADCKIFQTKTVVEILTGVFDDLGFTDYKNSTTGTYTARDYSVQYRETAFNFVSRLMEEEGIFYYFEHEDGKHTLVLADDSDGYGTCPVAEVEYDPNDSPGEDVIPKCSREEEVITARYAMDDFHFETSDTDLLVTADGEGMRWYEYPGGFTATDAGTARAGKRLGALEAAKKVLRGSSTVKTFGAGLKFTLLEHETEAMNIEYVLRKVSLKCDQQKYGDTFEAIPATVVFRPPLVTPKPVVHGAQTAIVVGKSGEEIWTDKYGRVKVQFHWDQVGVKDENSSCWIRVAQGWAGKSWGMMFLPRIGHEVIVSFLEGDPDRPIITGCVYNAQNTVPYTLPDDQTKSTIKSRSSKTGTAGNEIRFQDLKDSEEFYFHAQKDMKALVEHDWINHVKNSEQTFVQADDPTVETDFKCVLVVDGKRKVTIKGDANEETHINEGKFTQMVTKEFTLTVNGDTLTITAAGDLIVKGKTISLESTEGDVTIKSAANLKSESAQALENKAGTTLKNESGTALTNKAGTAMDNEAGTALTNKAGTTLTNDAGVSLVNKGSASQECDGGGMLTLKGGMVKIN